MQYRSEQIAISGNSKAERFYFRATMFARLMLDMGGKPCFNDAEPPADASRSELIKWGGRHGELLAYAACAAELVGISPYTVANMAIQEAEYYKALNTCEKVL